MKEIHYWYWLSSLWQIGIAKRRQLLTPYASPTELFYESHIAWECFPKWTEQDIQIFEASRSPQRIEEEYQKLLSTGMIYLPMNHEAYPQLLKEIYDPPFGLFCFGNLSALHKHTVGIVGTRICSHYGSSCASSTSSYLASHDVVIVSGMARGIDSYAHQGALSIISSDNSSAVTTVAVLGCGADICYPRENIGLYEEIRQHGCIISENPPDTPPLSHLFPLRNRIISGLSEAVVIIEAKKKSGSLITADCALEQGRHIFAVPGRIYDVQSEGCNHMISQGAAPMLHPDMVLEALHITPSASGKKTDFTKKTLEKQEILLYSCLDCEPLHIDEIARRSHRTVSDICATLLQMELKGIICQPVRNYYAKQIDF